MPNATRPTRSHAEARQTLQREIAHTTSGLRTEGTVDVANGHADSTKALRSRLVNLSDLATRDDWTPHTLATEVVRACFNANRLDVVADMLASAAMGDDL